MWVQPLRVVMTVKPWNSPHGGSRTTASLVSQNPNIPSASTQQLPILPKPTFNSRTPSSQVPNATAAIFYFFFFFLCYYTVRTNHQAQRIRSTAELGLLSLLFILSTDFAAVFSVAILCIPTINAMRRLASAMDKLSNVVSRWCPERLLLSNSPALRSKTWPSSLPICIFFLSQFSYIAQQIKHMLLLILF